MSRQACLDEKRKKPQNKLRRVNKGEERSGGDQEPGPPGLLDEEEENSSLVGKKEEEENLEQNRTSFLGIEELGRTPPDVSRRVCFGRSLSAGRRLHASATRILAEVGRSDDVFSGFDGNH